MIASERINIVPFKMKHLNDYYSEFNADITKFQWPDPFESMEDAKAMLLEFLNEMDREETLFFHCFQRTMNFLEALKFTDLLNLVLNWASG